MSEPLNESKREQVNITIGQSADSLIFPSSSNAVTNREREVFHECKVPENAILGSELLSPSDALLLDRLRDGDQEAFGALFLAYYQPVYRLIYRVTADREEAEDIAQEVFIRLYRQPLSRDRDHNLRAWLYRVALNQAFNSRRSSRRQSQRDERSASLEYTQRVEADPAENALRDEQRRQVRTVLRSLAPRQQQILILRHEGCSYAEIAEVVDVASGSVGTLLARAEAEFARRYQELFGGADK